MGISLLQMISKRTREYPSYVRKKYLEKIHSNSVPLFTFKKKILEIAFNIFRFVCLYSHTTGIIPLVF